MAENKKSFLVYCDLIHTVRKLSKEDAGELFLHLLEYTNDLNPVTKNPIVDIVFEPIKQQLKRDLRAYEETKEERSINGRLGNLKRWNLDLFNKVESNELTIDEAENIAKHRKTSLPDSPLSPPIANIAVTDTVTDTVKEINNNIEIFDAEIISFSFDEFWEMYPNKVGKKTAKAKFDKLTTEQKQRIEHHLPHFINYKPFKEYNYPNPTTYLNQERFNDEIQINNNNQIKILNDEQITNLAASIRSFDPRA